MLNVKLLLEVFNPSRGLLRDCTTSPMDRFTALVTTLAAGRGRAHESCCPRWLMEAVRLHTSDWRLLNTKAIRKTSGHLPPVKAVCLLSKCTRRRHEVISLPAGCFPKYLSTVLLIPIIFSSSIEESVSFIFSIRTWNQNKSVIHFFFKQKAYYTNQSC